MTGKEILKLLVGIALAMGLAPLPATAGACALEDMCSDFRTVSDLAAWSLIGLAVLLFVAGMWLLVHVMLKA